VATIALPTKDRKLERYATGEPIVFPSKSETQRFNRIAYAAAHVVADPLADIDPWEDAAIDWEKTIAFRHYLWDLGLGVAEAMDTAQRGGGLTWAGAKELIGHVLDAAKCRPGVKICCGVGTDHLEAAADTSIDHIIRAYEEQIEAIEARGGRLVVMASRALARAAKTPADYARVYGRILRQVKEPVIIHWLGEMFDPALAAYWGSADHAAAMETCLGIIRDNAAKIDGVKISLLSGTKEIEMRRKLPAGVRMYTGDDFNYAELIAGDEQGYSDALLGILMQSHRPPQRVWRDCRPATCRVFTASSSRLFRCPGISSRRQRDSTKPASCFSPGLTGCRTISSWSADKKAPARCCISPSYSALPTRRACCMTRI
jgi:Protein of unknown function (DUF993)